VASRLPDDVEQFLTDLDQLCFAAEQSGLSSTMIAGTLLARTQNWYLKDDPADLDGLERLYDSALKLIQSRPRFDIE